MNINASLRNWSFGLFALLIIILISATILEKLNGTAFVSQRIYSSAYFVLLWGLTALTGLAYLVRKKIYRHLTVFLLHLSLLLILAGALTTYLTGIQGSLHLRETEKAVHVFQSRDGKTLPLPFGIALKEFKSDYYPGTSAPMNYTSQLILTENGQSFEGTVSINHIYTHRHYRFYQSAYDADGKGSTLSVSYDPWGIALSYTGYASLLISFLLLFADSHTRFRKLLWHPLLKKATFCSILLALCANVYATPPSSLPRHIAETFGNLYLYYNNRICPLQTLAKDFILKIYGKPTYKGLTAEQVLTGWFFYYDEWKQEPMILIKNGKVRKALGVKEGQYARLADFTGTDGYKLDSPHLTIDTDRQTQRATEEANEKFSLISSVCTGNILKLYPYHEPQTPQLQWYSITDNLPVSIPQEQWTFIRYSLNLIAEQIAHHKYEEADRLLKKTREYQQKEAGTYLPSETKFRVEQIYNRLNYTRILAMCCLSIGILSFVFYIRQMIRQQKQRIINAILLTVLGGVFLYLVMLISLRGFISGHAPVSNGYETMQFMAVCSILFTFGIYRRFEISIAFGYMLCGLSLLVAMMGESNPPITQLMPVLASPLLSIHVVIIMIAYSLLAFVAMNGITAFILHRTQKDKEQIIRLQIISQLLLYPAVACLATGIFIGAVWANISWGRYWGWDPKEVWALITLLIYAAALHPTSLPVFRRPMFFHGFCILAFLSVLITYLGVNFLLGGLHGYV